MFGASVDSLFAVRARESGGTGASVRALAGVEARAVVLTRPMVGAEVQVLVAEQSTPALVAEALPLLLTRAVHAAGIALAFAAEPADPTWMTSAKEKKGTGD